MRKLPVTLCLPLAFCIAIASGCVAAGPTVLKTRLPVTAGETYGEFTGQPEYVPATPIGQEVVIPRGKAALTFYVVIPQKDSEDPTTRGVQAIDYSTVKKVDVTITGENLASPITTSINVSTGTSAAGTVIVTPGRNQLVTAVAKTSSGQPVATVKGVATSLSGQVVDAIVKYGTTPLANVIAGLNYSDAVSINTAAISGVIDPILGASVNPTTGIVTYAKHPLYIDSTRILNAINAVIADGTASSQVKAADISAKLNGVAPTYAASTLAIRMKDPLGNLIARLPSSGQNAKSSTPYDHNSDGIPDAAAYWAPGSSGTYDYGYIYPILLNDPLSAAISEWYYGNTSGPTITNIPPGSHTLTYDPYKSNYSYSRFPWWVLPLPASRSVPVFVAPGSSNTHYIQMMDVSKPTNITQSGGSFTGKLYEWYRVDTEANLIYYFNYGLKSAGPILRIFDHTGFQLFQGAATPATGSYTFASGATNSLYVYVPSTGATVSVTTESLASAQSLYNASINFGQ